MHILLGKRSLGGLLLAAMAAGTCCVSALAAQTASQRSAKTTHKNPGSSAAHASSSHTGAKSAAAKSGKSTGSRSASRKKKRVKGQAAPTPDRISEIQEALARKGALAGTPSGKWDDDTVDAMRKFQASNGLSPTGKLDAPTLQKLGLGSDTAGLGAPTPPPNSANRLRNATPSPPEPPSEPRE